MDTIVAVATATGRAAIGVVRLSGPDASAIAKALAGALPPPREAGLRTLRDHRGEPLDRGLVLVFPAPHSYTGEDVVEFQVHGSPVVLGALVEEACALGARTARPGEFTERAFLNERMDLAQAEAVADLIDAQSRAAARAALRSLEGAFSQDIEGVAQLLTDARVWVEGALDFSDDDVDWLADDRLGAKLDTLEARLSHLLARASAGRRLREGMTVAIGGAPNVGKSSLLNRLSRTEAAIVAHTPGTTRDLLREHVIVGGVTLTLIDTAGLRDTGDGVEREGIRRAREALANAELVLYLIDARDGLTPADHAHLATLPDKLPRLLVANKVDLCPGARTAEVGALAVSALTGDGIEHLEAAVLAHAGMQSSEEDTFMARARHLVALGECAHGLARARELLAGKSGAEFVAEELRRAQDALGQIRGPTTSDALLGEIFARFCIGK